MTIEARRIAFADLAADPRFDALTDEYAEECALAELPIPRANIALYEQIESSGCMHTLGAYSGNMLVGFVIVLVTPNPHYSVTLGVTESIFVAEEFRSTGAGLYLLRQARELAEEKGAVGLLVSSPSLGRLAEVLPHVGFRETNRVFFQRFE